MGSCLACCGDRECTRPLNLVCEGVAVAVTGVVRAAADLGDCDEAWALLRCLADMDCRATLRLLELNFELLRAR